jgi:hypothetical protein
MPATGHRWKLVTGSFDLGLGLGLGMGLNSRRLCI